MKKTIDIGVVGCGYWDQSGSQLPATAGLQYEMLCDASEERLTHLRSVYPEVEGATDYKAMLNGVGLDAVAISTPVRFHYAMAKAALLAGKHTFIEKPMASSVDECEELIDLAHKQGWCSWWAILSSFLPRSEKSKKSSNGATSAISVTSVRAALTWACSKRTSM